MSWYKAGTIAVNGTTVTGAGTNWTDNKMGIGPGQALLIPGSGTVKMYEIASVDSATKITLTSSAGTIAAGQAYAIMSFYTDSAPDFARRLSAQLSYYQSQMDGWQQIMTGTGSVTLQAPDGTQVTISSFKKLTDDMANKADKVSGAVPVNQGGTGATTATSARSSLGLGSAAVLNDSEATGSVLKRGDGITDASRSGELAAMGFMMRVGFGSYRFDAAQTGLIQRYSSGFYAKVKDTHAFLQVNHNNSTVTAVGAVGTFEGGFTWSSSTLYGTSNTTKASDGTLKAASPVARVVKSREESGRRDICEDGFNWCGSGSANAEAEGINISRLDVGVYVLTGSAGLASEGWQLLPPMDPAGMGELGVVEAEETESGGITIRLFKRRYMMGEDGDIVKTKGVPMDVPANSWIDIRLDMPADSIWNKRQKSAQGQ